jgi:hypothetical protein
LEAIGSGDHDAKVTKPLTPEVQVPRLGEGLVLAGQIAEAVNIVDRRLVILLLLGLMIE